LKDKEIIVQLIGNRQATDSGWAESKDGVLWYVFKLDDWYEFELGKGNIAKHGCCKKATA